jgi:group I intron endonuclease
MLNSAGVYIYQLQLDKSKFYIGSSFDIWKRVAQHRNSLSKKISTCPKFYNCIRKHGWDNFKFSVLEYINKSVITNSKEINNVLIEKEQFYLDNLSPTLNINKIAGSMLGYKHSESVRKIMSVKRRGISQNKSKVKLSYNISDKTKNNLSLRARNGVRVKVYDTNNNLINTYPTIASAAKYYDVDHNTMSKCIINGNLINNYRFVSELKDVRV